MHVYAPTTSYSEEEINSDVDETLGKPNHYTMGDFNVQIGKRTNRMETATGKFGLELRNERGDTMVEWSTKKVQNHEYHVPEESREEMDMEKPKRCNENRN